MYQSAEDNIADTVKPRLVAAGADCDMVAYIVDEDYPLTLEDSRIEQVLQQTGARLFILDPLQGYLSQDSDMTNAGRMRSQLKMLMYGKEASNRKQEIDRQHYTIPNQRPKDKHCGKI